MFRKLSLTRMIKFLSYPSPICLNTIVIFSYLTYFSINFLWNSDLRESLMNVFSFLSGSERAQFLNTTSSSHLLLTWKHFFITYLAIYKNDDTTQFFSRFYINIPSFIKIVFIQCSNLSHFHCLYL